MNFAELSEFKVFDTFSSFKIRKLCCMTITNPAQADPALVERLYHTLSLIRRSEERIAEVYPSDKIKSPIHLAIGQEFIVTAICDHLHASDYVAATYRGHGAYLAKGASLAEMVAEMYGKETGCAKGRGGSMHLISKEHRVIGTSAVVATGIPVAVGHAMAIKMQAKDDVVVCFFGDGATEEGCFLESVNFAALHKLPILFVCENNFYAIHEPIEKRWATPYLCERIATFGIKAQQFSQPDILALHHQAGAAIERIRSGQGPEFMECHAYRWREHVGPNEDFDQGYRDESEMAGWREQDPYACLAERIEPDTKARIDREIEQQIIAAFEFAESSAFPEPAELYRYAYAHD
jgi:pyruvate dehydrogenase E1 component alpha subunit